MSLFDRFRKKSLAETNNAPTPQGGRFSDHLPTKLRAKSYNATLGKLVRGYADDVPTDRCPPIDLFQYKSDAVGRPYETLVTSGMSDRQMNVPVEHPTIPRRAEIVLYVNEPAEAHFLWIKWAAKFPFIDDTYLDHGHTIPWHEPLFPGSELSCILFLHSIVREDDALRNSLSVEGDLVNLLWLVPITRPEWTLKRERGLNALLDVFDRHQHPTVLNENRTSYV